MIKEILYTIILFLGIPTGLLLSSLCKEELQNWKNKILLIILISPLIILILNFTNFQYKIPIIISLLFIIVTMITILKKPERNIYIVKKTNKGIKEGERR